MGILSAKNYSILKTNLRLAIQRLKLASKKKSELILKSRREIADYLQLGKPDRARIRAEHVIREDFLVEAMDMVELFCDTLLARFGMIEHLPTLGEDLAEAVFSLVWVAPRLTAEIKELGVISSLLTSKYGAPCANIAKESSANSPVNTTLMLKLGVEAPPKALVERYLLEIARIYNAPYKPDEVILDEDDRYRPNNNSGTFPGAQKLGFETLQNDLPPLPLIPPVSNFKMSTHEKSTKPSGTDEKISLKEQSIIDFDESQLPSVPNFNEDMENAHPTDNAPNGNENNDDDDYFENIKRRFAALKKKQM